MENVYFKGLEKALNDGCYIKVFSCAMRYPVVRVEKKNIENGQEELISYAENGNVLATLNSASSNIIDEFAGKEVDSSKIWCERTSIDKAVEQGYTLHFFKLSNNQVLSMICTRDYGGYIPIKSIMANDIQSSLETLNATLQPFTFEHDFFNFVNDQTAPIHEYQKKITQEKTK